MRIPTLITLPALLLTLVSSNLNAQHYFGLRTGANFATVTTTEEGFITKKRTFGMNGVVFFDFSLAEKLSLQPEVSFIQKGYRRTINLLGEKNYATKLNYFECALLLKFRFGEDDLKGYTILGPFLGRASSGKSIDLDDGSSNPVKFDAGGGFHREDLGMIIGAGIGLPAGPGNFIVDIRYLWGLYNINESYLDDGNLRNQGINVSLGYAFLLGR